MHSKVDQWPNRVDSKEKELWVIQYYFFFQLLPSAVATAIATDISIAISIAIAIINSG